MNLNSARKAKLRAEKPAKAAANAVKFGRTKAQKRAEGLAADKAAAHLNQHKSDPKP